MGAIRGMRTALTMKRLGLPELDAHQAMIEFLPLRRQTGP
jgi:hypothetical protein